MIICDHCKLPTPAGMVSCQHCGNPLTKTPNARNAPFRAQGMEAPGQPELPAWLETLRAGERPASSAAGNTGAASFFGADLIDEGALPSWMRPERAEHIDNTPSGKYPALRPASALAPNTDGAFPPAGGMAANSLIDEQSLPLWMQGEQQGSQYQGRENISAASLVQPGALPDWITSLESQTPAPASPASSSSIQYPPAAPGSQPIAARDLIDQQALPGWMAGQNTPSPASGQGFAASSLLDPHALPAWMREENQQQRQSNVEAIQSAQSGQVPNYQGPIGQGPLPNTNNNLVAASLIDANALPEWLRTAEDQRQGSQGMASYQTQQSFTDNPRQATFGVPPRPDNLRVPGRPRGEMEYLEESEAAANTFASMLGVASVAPNLPGQQPNDAFGRSQPPAQYQQNMPQAYSGTGMPVPGPQRQQGQVGQSAVGMPPTAYPGMAPGQGYAPNQPQTSAGYPGGYQMGNMPGVSTQPPMTSNDPSNANKKPARRGFLSTILDWFSLSR